MPRYIQQGWWFDGNGKVVKSGTVTVYLAGTSTAASIYTASSGGTAVNAVTASSTDGSWSFYVDTDDYARTQKFKIVFSKSGFTSKTTDNVVIFPEYESSWYNVKDYGATGDGVTDDTDAFNEAAALGIVYAPAGTYLLSDTISHATAYPGMIGDGEEVTNLLFNPTAHDKIAVDFTRASNVLGYYARAEKFTIKSTDTSYRKIGIKSTNQRGITIENVSMTQMTDTSYSTIGIQLLGRDQIIIKRPTISADLPINIKSNPGIGTGVAGIEYAHFQDVYLGSLDDATGTIFKVDDDISFTNVTFDGYNIFFGGKNGFVAENLEIGTGAVGHYLSFNNIQWDQPAAASGWFFKIACNGAAGAYLNISFKNCGIYTGSVTGYNGWSITDYNQSTTKFDNCVYPADATGTNFGGTFTPGNAGNYPAGGTVLASGTQAALTAIDVSAVVPIDAKYIWGYATLSQAATAIISPKSDGGGQVAIISAGALTVPFWLPIITVQNIYYSISAGNLTIYVSGYGA